MRLSDLTTGGNAGILARLGYSGAREFAIELLQIATACGAIWLMLWAVC